MTEFEEPAHRVRVRYCETDRMAVAHHGSYVAWFEEARTEWMRQRGRTYREIEDAGDLLQVVEFLCSYHKSVDYDEIVAIRVRVESSGRAAIVLGYEARRESDGEVCATGSTKLACVGRDGNLRRLPKELIDQSPGSSNRDGKS
jgi:acyl-CoA thioester hydrolase